MTNSSAFNSPNDVTLDRLHYLYTTMCKNAIFLLKMVQRNPAFIRQLKLGNDRANPVPIRITFRLEISPLRWLEWAK
jgi:hypothetical protein